MRIHDEWIHNTINYITNERNDILKSLNILKDGIKKENFQKQ